MNNAISICLRNNNAPCFKTMKNSAPWVTACRNTVYVALLRGLIAINHAMAFIK